ncbi:hypothetical protein DPMN_132949 [Dreissena polymorpha]|uniref:Uncharacterized protein n=1 Tax=Dreissena polymorpha TaxID=45954 RepID=A0A9D4FUR2_DREPO|nr:hypothetical protein DPMN_132949 [Dreissena polymorpha]
MGNVFNWGRGMMSILRFQFHDDDLDLLQYWKGKVRQLPIVYFHFYNNPTVLIDVDYMYLRILLDSKKDRQTDRQTNRQIQTDTDRQTDRQTDIQTDTDRQTNRQTDRQTNR